jgi:hypothetical protein
LHLAVQWDNDESMRVPVGFYLFQAIRRFLSRHSQAVLQADHFGGIARTSTFLYA